MMNRRVFVAGALALTGCASTPPRLETLSRSDALALSDIRFDAGAEFDIWSRHLNIERMRGEPTVLALSSGGEDGAFGAGVLTGWTRTGTRPEFDVVTGVSTGSLIAPFAFLGSDYDNALQQIYTAHGMQDIATSRGVLGLLDDALSDTAPLRKTIASYVTADLIARVGERHASGARLFVVTSNLDTGRATIWNMGEIASRGYDDLFRDAMLASSSIPGVFPPVTLTLPAPTEGSVRETHVDGGVNMQLLAVPDAAFPRVDQLVRPNGKLYVLVNNTLDPAPQPVSRSTLPIMQRTFSTMVRSNAAEAIDSARRFAARTQMSFQVAMIDRDFDVPYDPSDRFSRDYMRALYQYGYQRAVRNEAWR